MPSEVCIFRRIEKKYLLTHTQYQKLLSMIAPRLIPDEHGKSTICSLYLDTPDFRLIRASIDAKAYGDSVYKEKLRLRSYGTPSENSKVFLEIKKKYKGVVYKRRVSMTQREAMDYIRLGKRPLDSQIMREIDYAMRYYNHPQPAALLCYEREAYFVKGLPNHRLTFDTGVRYRQSELSLVEGSRGKLILPSDTVLMEIKTDGSMPLWLASALDRLCIYPASFSKYGTAYRDIYQIKAEPKIIIPQKGETAYA